MCILILWHCLLSLRIKPATSKYATSSRAAAPAATRSHAANHKDIHLQFPFCVKGNWRYPHAETQLMTITQLSWIDFSWSHFWFGWISNTGWPVEDPKININVMKFSELIMNQSTQALTPTPSQLPCPKGGWGFDLSFFRQCKCLGDAGGGGTAAGTARIKWHISEISS